MLRHEIIRTLFREQNIAIFSILTAFSMTISTIVLSITSVSGRSGRLEDCLIIRFLNTWDIFQHVKQDSASSRDDIPKYIFKQVNHFVHTLGPR